MILYKKPGFQIGLLVTVSFFTFIYIRPKHADIREHGKERKTLIKCQHFNTAGFMTTALLVYQYTLLGYPTVHRFLREPFLRNTW